MADYFDYKNMAVEQAKKYGLSIDLYRSIVAFNGSPRTDRTSPRAFMTSFLTPPSRKAMLKQVRFRGEIQMEITGKWDSILRLMTDLLKKDQYNGSKN